MTMAEPVLKWAGGKRQLLHEIDKQLPAALKTVKLGGIGSRSSVEGPSFSTSRNTTAT